MKSNQIRHELPALPIDVTRHTFPSQQVLPSGDNQCHTAAPQVASSGPITPYPLLKPRLISTFPPPRLLHVLPSTGR